MSRVLEKAYHVYHEGQVLSFLPGDMLPDDIEGGDHLFVSDDAAVEDTEATRPPEKGKGSSRDAWVAYAESRGVLVDDAASKEDIVDALNDLDAEAQLED